MADSIFCQPNTITGSIGVFAMIPNMEKFFKDKLGVTFDGVKTSQYADALTITRPLSADERRIMQHQVDVIYTDFKQRVAQGRKRDTAYIDSIAQGRVWTGQRALTIGLTDKLGGIDEAIRSAASLARMSEYNIREYPEPRSPFKELFGSYGAISQSAMEKEFGKENYLLFKRIKQLKENVGVIQARLPFDFTWK
jgi:protease-4